MASPHFGRRVIGNEEFERQRAAAEGGGATFGPRVMGKAVPKPTGSANRPRTPGSGRPKDLKPPTDDTGISLDQLRSALGDNPTLALSLFEQELARPAGPREEALLVLRGYFADGTDEARDIAILLVDHQAKRDAVGDLDLDKEGKNPPADTPPAAIVIPSDEELATMGYKPLRDLAIKLEITPLANSKAGLFDSIVAKAKAIKDAAAALASGEASDLTPPKGDGEGEGEKTPTAEA